MSTLSKWFTYGVIGVLGVQATQVVAVDFAREVLPILSDKCFACHGPDTKKKTDLRLDSFEGATADLGGYRAINPEKLEESAVLLRIHDKDDPMPPEDAEKQLTEKEMELISLWVREGGEYSKHWAFEVPVKSELPVEGVEHPIDSFVLQKLQSAGADFAPEASKSILARRLALTLTGLPLEIRELKRFMADNAPGAYERLVDRLLKDPKFGEHQARFWLDAIRYGDTHGLHLDNRRGIYPFRDWVVRSFNDNLPLDDFITWQVAGDLLPNPTLEQVLATGFIRMNPTTSEGGAIPEEFQAKNSFDRTETFGTVFLGMTMTCARCHTHKYDPIPHTEYYRLMAFFNNTAEGSMDGNSYTYGPTIRVPDNQAAWTEWESISEERDALLKSIASEPAFQLDTLLEAANSREGWKVSGWKKGPAKTHTAALPVGEAWESIEGEKPDLQQGNLPEVGESVWVAFNVEAPVEQTLWVTFSGGEGSRVFLNRNPLNSMSEVLPEQRYMKMPLTLRAGVNEVWIQASGVDLATPLRVSVENPWKSLIEAKSWKDCDSTDQLMMLADLTGPLAELDASMLAAPLAWRVARSEANFTTSLVARELDKPRETKVLRRGEYNMATGDPLEPGVLSIMGDLPEGAPRNRLGLAQWLTSPEHPVTTRTLVNQFWQNMFGNGLVRSPEDFGLQGRQPTHPELLDWLAVELRESGWDMKSMIRLMVTSRTFKQESAFRSDLSDRENLYFGRGPTYRLDAETLRDLSLWASGILDPHMGGEGVKPYQPSGMWQAMAHPASNTKLYVADQSKRLYRRSLYVYWKRTSPHPMMTLFDAPNRETSCLKRSRTSTPLQSLGLFNETQRLEMAAQFAHRLVEEAFSDEERLDRMFMLLTSRPANDIERKVCMQLLNQMRERYKDHPEEANELLSYGASGVNHELDPSEQASWAQVAITVLASDASILMY